MDLTNNRMPRVKYLTAVLALAAVLVSCTVSYKFNGASIDYSKTKTIEIADFPIRSSYVWAPMGNL